MGGSFCWDRVVNDPYSRPTRSALRPLIKPTLAELALKYVTDKFIDVNIFEGISIGKGHSYIPIYEKYFNKIREQPISLLEIGVFRGASIRMWLDYFEKGLVYGMDIGNPECVIHPRYTPLKMSSTDIDRLMQLRDEQFDIIIDDGDHALYAQLTTLHLFWRTLKVGGLYFIEDTIDDYVRYFKQFHEQRMIIYNYSKIRNYPNDILLMFRK
jgi:cephalosporin hydroxylase